MWGYDVWFGRKRFVLGIWSVGLLGVEGFRMDHIWVWSLGFRVWV